MLVTPVPVDARCTPGLRWLDADLPAYAISHLRANSTHMGSSKEGLSWINKRSVVAASFPEVAKPFLFQVLCVPRLLSSPPFAVLLSSELRS